MSRLGAVVVGMCAALVVPGCSRVATQVIVHVEADADLASMAERLELEVWNDAGVRTYDRAIDQPTFPATLPVSAASETSPSGFRVRATATWASTHATSVSAHVRFVLGARTHVYLRLETACDGVPCTRATSTCEHGACVDDCVVAASGAPTPFAACSSGDGGVGDASVDAPDLGADANDDASGGADAGCTEGAACTDSGTAGTCHAGSCCTGCWTGTSCRDVGTQTNLVCGGGGVSCFACPCAGDRCVAGACAPAADRVPDAPDVVPPMSVWRHACVRVTGGRLACWGSAEGGQLGDGHTTGVSTPTWIDTAAGLVGAADGVGTSQTCYANDAGRACTGSNFHGALGIGDAMDHSTPVFTDDGSSYVSIRMGTDFGCGRESVMAHVRCWGENALGQLARPDTTPFDAMATEVLRGGAPLACDALAAGSAHVLAIERGSTRRIVGWGDNAHGQLGADPTTLVLSRAPVVVDLHLASFEMGTGAGVYGISGGAQHSCAFTYASTTPSDSRVRCWGEPGPWLGPHPSPVPSWDPGEGFGTPSGDSWGQVVAGARHSCGVVFGGGPTYCWGDNGAGALGSAGATTETPTLVDTSGTHGNHGWTYVAAGDDATCGITSNGSVYCWGSNANGLLGQPRANSDTPVRICLPPL